MENEKESKIKCLRTSRGGEFTSKEFNDLCDLHGIKIELSVTKTPKQNGVVERRNITIQEMARTMLLTVDLQANFGEKQLGR